MREAVSVSASGSLGLWVWVEKVGVSPLLCMISCRCYCYHGAAIFWRFLVFWTLLLGLHRRERRRSLS